MSGTKSTRALIADSSLIDRITLIAGSPLQNVLAGRSPADSKIKLLSICGSKLNIRSQIVDQLDLCICF